MVPQDDSAAWLDTLNANVGFDRPEDWVGYARMHGFRKVAAKAVHSCPDCGGPVSATRKIGQYVYYSNLGQLRECQTCQLIFSTLRLDPTVIQTHFDHAYNDEDYFVRRRRDIFDQFVKVVDSHAPLGGQVLDIGGAKGHAMAALRQERPDLAIVVNDLSQSKCEWAQSHYGLRSLCGSATELLAYPETFDVITLIDVLYYEANLSQLWDALAHLLKPGGTVIIRIPNNYFRVICFERVLDWCVPRRLRDKADTVRYFNPEHLYVLSRKYLMRRLQKIGFSRILWLPSALLIPNEGSKCISVLYGSMAKALHCMLSHHGTITPGIIVVATGKE